MVAYLIIHLDASIPCLSPTVYKYIESVSISPEFCSIDDVVDVELKELNEKVHSPVKNKQCIHVAPWQLFIIQLKSSSHDWSSSKRRTQNKLIM